VVAIICCTIAGSQVGPHAALWADGWLSSRLCSPDVWSWARSDREADRQTLRAQSLARRDREILTASGAAGLRHTGSTGRSAYRSRAAIVMADAADCMSCSFPACVLVALYSSAKNAKRETMCCTESVQRMVCIPRLPDYRWCSNQLRPWRRRSRRILGCPPRERPWLWPSKRIKRTSRPRHLRAVKSCSACSMPQRRSCSL
jgi:hypothetical protein